MVTDARATPRTTKGMRERADLASRRCFHQRIKRSATGSMHAAVLLSRAQRKSPSERAYRFQLGFGASDGASDLRARSWKPIAARKARIEPKKNAPERTLESWEIHAADSTWRG